MKQLIIKILFVLVSIVSMQSQIVNFKPTGFYSDDVYKKYGLKFDSIQVYSYGTDYSFTIFNYSNIDLKTLSNINGNVNSSDSKIKVISDSKNLQINFESMDIGRGTLELYDISGRCILNDIIQLNEANNVFIYDKSELPSGLIVILIKINDKVFTKKFINGNDFTSDNNNINYEKLEYEIDNYMYRFTAYSKNRNPVILDSFDVENVDTIKIKFDFEYPYRFIKVNVNIKLSDCRVKHESYQGQTGYTGYNNYLSDTREYEIQRDTTILDSNRYYFYSGYHKDAAKESITYAIIDFVIENNQISNMDFSSTRYVSGSGVLGWDILNFKFQNSNFKINENILKIGLGESALTSNLKNVVSKDNMQSTHGTAFDFYTLLEIYSFKNSQLVIELSLY